MKSLVYLGLLAILGTISDSNCYRINSAKAAFSNYIENELETTFGICPKLLSFKRIRSNKFRVLTCELDETNTKTGKICMIGSEVNWIRSSVPGRLSGNNDSFLLCVSSKDLTNISTPILKGLNMFKILNYNNSDQCCLRNQIELENTSDFWTNVFSNVTSFDSTIDDVVVKLIFPINVDDFFAYYAAYDLSESVYKPANDCFREFNSSRSVAKCWKTESGDVADYVLGVFLVANL